MSDTTVKSNHSIINAFAIGINLYAAEEIAQHPLNIEKMLKPLRRPDRVRIARANRDAVEELKAHDYDMISLTLLALT
jgi:hypothetical protein